MLAVFSSQYHTTTVGSFGCSGTCCLSMCPLKSTLIYCALSSSQVVGCEVAPGWWNTPAFVQVLLESRGSLNQNFYRIENHELNVMIAAGLADWKSELLFSGKHWCFQKKQQKTNQKPKNKHPNKTQPKKQKQTPKQNPTKKTKTNHSQQKTLSFQFRKSWAFFSPEDHSVVKVKDLWKWVVKSNFAEDF